MHANVYTIAILPARDGRIGELLTTLESLALDTRQEHGCIEYGFYQDADNPRTVLSFERWVDGDAEEGHWGTSHLRQAIEAMDDLLESPPQIFKSKKVI